MQFTDSDIAALVDELFAMDPVIRLFNARNLNRDEAAQIYKKVLC